MRVFVESALPCDAERAWAEVQTSALLFEVCRPMVTFRPLPGETFPERWPNHATLRLRCFLFGVVPLGTRTLTFERIDDQRREIQTHEYDALVRRWDHLIRVAPIAPGECRYSDTIEIEAGILTPAVWLFATFFYQHRQRRWQAVARRLQGEATRKH
jgi:hypothetical protein